MRRAAAIVALMMGACASASAQQGTLPATALEDFPHVPISNGLITAQVYPPGEKQLYRGTRFDHAGVVFHVTYKGQDYSTYWFDRFVTDPSDESQYPSGVQHSCCAVSGPVEEFAAVGFEEAGMGGRFLKPGIGIFKRDNDNPFVWSAEKPLQPELVKLDGKTIRYIAPIPKGVTTISLMNGFSDKASDYDFRVTNTKTGFGQRIRADQPIAKINMWSISPTYSLEPYIAISLKPGETKRWTYTYDFFGPGEEEK
jgi:hypothetical protein